MCQLFSATSIIMSVTCPYVPLALYGDRHYWIRPEKMFFETVTRDGRSFARITEIDKD